MALKALKCPNCDANIQVDDNRDYGFCSYCGAQVQIREVVEVRYSGEIQINDPNGNGYEHQMEKGTAFMKIGEYYKAEQVFYRLINEYPGRPEGYEMLIRAITRDSKIFIKENYDRVMNLTERMYAVAPAERKKYYENFCQTIREDFEYGMQEQRRQETFVKIGKQNKVIKDNIIIFLVCVAIIAACLILGNNMLLLRSFLFPVGVVAGSSLLTIIVSKVKKEWLLRKEVQEK